MAREYSLEKTRNLYAKFRLKTLMFGKLLRGGK